MKASIKRRLHNGKRRIRRRLKKKQWPPQRRRMFKDRNVAPRHGAVDPRATRERLSVIPLGRLAYLKGKPGGENSMSGKPRRSEIA